MRKPDPVDEIRRSIKVEAMPAVIPVLAAEAVVVVALFMGGAIIVRGHTLWAVVIGWLP